MIALLEVRPTDPKAHVVPGKDRRRALVGFPKILKPMVRGTQLADVTAHVLRHSFASNADDLDFTEATVAALIGHSRGTTKSKYIHSVDTSLIVSADTLASYKN